MSSWLDHLPSHERAKIRARLRSPEEYERLRERVKGPEDLEHELKYNESLADLKFSIEMEPKFSESLHQHIEKDIQKKGIEALIDNSKELSPDTRRLLEEGRFQLRVEGHPESGKDVLIILPEGKPAERLPLKQNINEQYISYISCTDQSQKIDKNNSGLSQFYS